MTGIQTIASFIDGAAVVRGQNGFTLVSPQDGAPFAYLAEAGPEAIEDAVTSADAAFRKHRGSSRAERAGWLRAAGRALMENNERIAQLVSHDIGKPIRLARVEVQRAVEFLGACADTVLTISGEEVIPLDAARLGAGHFGFTRRVAFGVVAAITPFNAPVNLVIQKIGPAVAAGNSVVVKPAPSGARTALALAELFSQAGWPAGLFNAVTGDREAAFQLAAHARVAAVSFTGGTAAGEALIKAAGVKKFVAELGSNAANIVLADADLPAAAQKIAGAAFEASGQQCISAQRILVESSVYDSFLDLFLSATRKLKVGRADDDATDVGPMVHRAAADRVMAMIDDALKCGARVALGNERQDCIVAPTVLVTTGPNARVWQEEIFGPVALIHPVANIDEAIGLANDSRFGLQGAVFTRSLADAFRFAQDFDVGALWINEASRFRLDMYPFGGVKLSGIGREGVRYAMEELSQVKFIGIKP